MLHQMLVSYRYTAFDCEEPEDVDASMAIDEFLESKKLMGETSFVVKTDQPGFQYFVNWDRNESKMSCDCPFFVMNELVCGHCFCVMTALQIKHLNYFKTLGHQWSDEVNPEDPSCRELLVKVRQQKQIMSFIDKVVEKNRQKRAMHKGGFVPLKKRKVNVEFYPSSGSDFEQDDKEDQ